MTLSTQCEIDSGFAILVDINELFGDMIVSSCLNGSRDSTIDEFSSDCSVIYAGLLATLPFDPDLGVVSVGLAKDTNGSNASYALKSVALISIKLLCMFVKAAL